MAIINYNSYKVKRDILPNLSSSVTNIKIAYTTSTQLGIPSDFKYKTKLKSLYSELKNSYDSLNSIYNKVKDSETNFSSAEALLQKNVSNINNISVSLRKSIIR